MKKVIGILFLLVCLTLTSRSQKLPKVQREALLIPDDLKVDGQATEWANNFQAYDTNNRVFYTIANDDKKIYLLVQSDDLNVNDKILIGGITFTLKAGKKDIAITYPMAEEAQKSMTIRGSSRRYTNLGTQVIANKSKIDSLVNVANYGIDTRFKNMKVTGVTGITETYLPIYNAENIVVRAKFNQEMKYTYELTLPISMIGLADADKDTFKYNIKLNGVPIASTNGRAAPVSDTPSQEYLYANTPTNLSGEYTLTKK